MNRISGKKKRNKSRLLKKQLFLFLSAFIFILSFSPSIHCQSIVQWPDKDNLNTIRFCDPNKSHSFIASVSLVALFTSGTKNRDGFRIGLGFHLAYHTDPWLASIGLDFYKAKEHLGIGTTYLGYSFDNGDIGVSYLVNQYFQEGRQVSAIMGLKVEEFEVKVENDILAYPFAGFKRYDRFRTSAIEFRYKRILLGVNVYTTDIDGVTDFSYTSKKGIYRQGKQISTPIYAGYTDKGLLIRTGINSRIGGQWGQNKMHRWLFDTPDFKEISYTSHFLQIGTNQPYTLY